MIEPSCKAIRDFKDKVSEKICKMIYSLDSVVPEVNSAAPGGYNLHS